MIDSLKKAFLAGVGASVATKEKIEAVLDELVEKGRLSKEEAKETADRIVEDGKAEFASARSELDEFVEKVMDRGNFASVKRVDALEERIAALEALHADEESTAENPGD